MKRQNKTKLKREKQFNTFAGLCVVLLGALVAGMVCPAPRTGVNAASEAIPTGTEDAEVGESETGADGAMDATTDKEVTAGDATEGEELDAPEKAAEAGMGGTEADTEGDELTEVLVEEPVEALVAEPTAEAASAPEGRAASGVSVSMSLPGGAATVNTDQSVLNKTFYSSAGTLTVSGGTTGAKVYLTTGGEHTQLENVRSVSDPKNPSSTEVKGVINPVAKGTVPAGFGANTWGYAITDGAANGTTPFNPIYPTLDMSSPAYTVAKGTTATQVLTIGMAIDGNLAAGQYKTTVMISVFADPATIATD